ncbi:MlaD family protein [Nonomuraea typhae]|uniref:MlaD family protein n=1 Tax=Nonomuraea typhae TaxID=2603600 RepID=A0ABW7YP80_9ACTN
MKNLRVSLNLGFFALLGVVMAVWAFTTIIRLDAIERPYRVSAEFESSPGLIRGFDVAYLGVRVGKIGEVRLAPGKIVVGLDIDREIRLPRAVSAEVRRKSAIGEPYVELSPPEEPTGGNLAPGETIPLTRTTVPLDYKRLFEGVGKLLNAVPPEDARTITHELAVALEGRAPAIRSIVDDVHGLTGTLADNAAVLDDLAVQLTRLTRTLAGRRDKLASGIDDTELVTASLAASRRELNAFLDQGPGVFAQLDALVKRARPGFSCMLTAAGMPHRPVFSPESERNVNHLLSVVPTALSLAGDISDRRDGTVYGRTMFVFSVPGGPKVAEEYAEPLGPPPIPAPRACPKRPVPAGEPRPDGHDAPETRPGQAKDTAEAQPATGKAEERTTDSKPRTPAPRRSAATAADAPLNNAPLLVAIFLAVVACGGIVGWIAVGRAARRRETELS